MRDSTHLLVQVQGAYFGTLPDSQFNTRARLIAHFSFRHYGAWRVLDSVTVSVGQALKPGSGANVFRVGRSVTLPVSALQ